jgi:hypothetical protein
MSEMEYEAWMIQRQIAFAPRPPPEREIIKTDQTFLPGIDVFYMG